MFVFLIKDVKKKNSFDKKNDKENTFFEKKKFVNKLINTKFKKIKFYLLKALIKNPKILDYGHKCCKIQRRLVH